MKIYIQILLLFSFIGLFAQNNQDEVGAKNLYNHALTSYLNFDSNRENILIEENPISTKGIERKDVSIKYNAELQKTAKKNRKEGVEFLRIVPMRIKNGLFYVTIIHFKLTYKKRTYQYLNVVGETFYYEYDCGSKKFIYQNNK